MKLAVVGAKGAVGQKLVEFALAADNQVVAIELEWSNKEDNEHIRFVEADVLNDDLSIAFAGCDAVLSCLGVGNSPKVLLNPPPLYTEGTKNIISAMKNVDIDRLIVISASFVQAKNRGPSYFKLPVMAALHNVLDQMAQMEELLKASSINWTAVRPGWLMQGDLTEDYMVTKDVIPSDLIRTRMSDLAHFMLQLALSGEWLRQTPALSRKEEPEASSLAAVVKEIMG
jgi:putative NADH-flavin reductase